MKLNKPTVTENQSELESYVESLLKDNVELVPAAENPAVDSPFVEGPTVDGVSIDNKVTPLRTTKALVKDALAEQKEAGALHKETKKRRVTEAPSAPAISRGELSENQGTDSLPKQPVKQSVAKQSDNNVNKQPKVIEKPNQLSKQVEGNSRSQQAKQPDRFGRSDSAQQHHDKIAKEFKAYQENAHANTPEPDPRLKNVEKLLSRIALASAVVPTAESQSKTADQTVAQTTTTRQKNGPTADSQLKTEPVNQDTQAVSAEVAEASFLHRDAKPMKDLLGDVFQTLVFEVHKLPLAVPLVKLGGIVNLSEQDVTPLVGTPDWFLGLVPNERGNLMVVDTQKFLMPEKAPTEPLEYEYLIVLDNSNWALACHAVNDAKNLSPDDIRWSARSSKRPWFAGMVVEFMSALVEVDELINMLAENVVE